jgi:hypothetical protein
LTLFLFSLSLSKRKEQDLLKGMGMDNQGLLASNQGPGVHKVYNPHYGLKEDVAGVSDVQTRSEGDSYIFQGGGTSFSINLHD